MTSIACSISDCDRGGRLVRGMCGMHYQRVAKAEKPCSVTGCENGGANGSTGFCLTHHNRLVKHGSPHVTLKGRHNITQVLADGRRVCKKCGAAKPATEFHRDSGSFDGFRSQCKPCRNGFMADYYLENSDERKAAVQEYRDNNLEVVRETDTRRYFKHREKRIELAKVHRYIRRAREVGADTDSGITHTALREIHGDSCVYCGVTMNFDRRKRGDVLPNRATIEHAVPISLGGNHVWSNVTLACHACNVSRGNKDLNEWLASRDARAAAL